MVEQAGHPHQLQARAEGLAQTLPALLLAAERVAEIVMHGVHGRRRAGPGEEFWQYRAYAPGDAASLIDWRKSARAQRAYVRETEWMAANTLWLWVQQDAGMGWRSYLARESKHERALLLALALARLAQRAGERVGIPGAPFPPDHARAAFERMAAWWWRRRPQAMKNAATARVEKTDGADDGGRSLPPVVSLPRFSSLVLIGDFFADPVLLRQRLTQLAATGARGHLLQVVDPAEESFPYQGRMRFLDMAGTRAFLSERAEDLRTTYQARLRGLRDELAAHARRLGWTFRIHRTDQPPQATLLALYAHLAEQPLAAGAHEEALPPVPATAGGSAT